MSHSLSSTNVQEQEGMQNPFEFSEDKILDDVYRTHFDCFEKCDVTSLQTVASNVINHSIDISEKVISKVIWLHPFQRTFCIQSNEVIIRPNL